MPREEGKEAAQRVEQGSQGNRVISALDSTGTMLTSPSPAPVRHVLGLASDRWLSPMTLSRCFLGGSLA